MVWLLADSNSVPWWSATIATLVGGLISLVATLGVTFWTDYLKQNQERRRVAALVAAGFNAIAKHLEENQVRAEIVKLIGEATVTKTAVDIHLIFPIRGSFLGFFDKLEATLPGRLLQRAVREIVVLRGLTEDFETLEKVRNWQHQIDFCSAMIRKLEICERELPELVDDLLQEAKVSRDTLTDFVTD
jgi:hypothetical protein